MNPQRKRIIISEIKYWKQNKLLPEHYCDFLITLYAQGEGDNEFLAKPEEAIFVKEKKNVNRTIIQLTTLAILVCSSMFVLVQYPEITLTLATMLTFAFLLMTFRKKMNRSIAPFLYILASFMILAISLKLWFVYFDGHTMLLLGLLMLNCSLWLFAGRLLKLLYFTISGTAGLLLIIGFLLISF